MLVRGPFFVRFVVRNTQLCGYAAGHGFHSPPPPINFPRESP
jgi:hypothetical protein